MKKLEVGDYVKNLTEKQFDKIMEFQPPHGGKYLYCNKQTDTLFLNNLYNGYQHIDFPVSSDKHKLKKELTYRQFLSRAKNTFK